MANSQFKHSDALAMQRLLERQVAKATDVNGMVDVVHLVGLIGTTYEEFNRDRRRVDRSNQVMAEELAETNRDLAKTAAILKIQNERFEAAVNNMSQGLCMFDRHGILVVHNKRLLNLLRLSDDAKLHKLSVEELVKDFRRRREAGPESEPTAKSYLALTQSTTRASMNIEFQNGQVLAVVHHPMSDGGFVHTFEDVTDRYKAEAKVNHLASHDVLTDLPNRRLLKQRVETELGQAFSRSAMLCLDLDRFKWVNDTLGHAAGDEMLTEVARRLRDSVRAGDTIARLGGDEFAIFMAGVREEADAGALASRIVREIGKPFDLAGNTVNIGVSIGLAMAPRDGDSPERLIKSADMALYEAKRLGRGCFAFFEPAFDALAHKRRALEMDLRRALDEHQFELHYQPQIISEGGYVVGFEALLRWNNPERGQISPMEFIPLAEELGLIIPLGDWVVQQACLTATAWPSDVIVAVNVSARQFVNHDFVRVVHDALEKSGLEPSRLELEITETALMDNSSGISSIMRSLRQLGVGIAMDDFGTGYSSLAYLRRFSFTRLKIDRSFVSDLGQDPQSIAIVRAVVALCGSLGIVTIAEGVETLEQANILKSENCLQLQGYLYGRPGPASKVAETLRTHGHKSAPRIGHSEHSALVYQA
jgi:diguanylate cyclase (GGDEF)-like protein